MRHILVLKAGEDTVIVNLPENDLYSFSVNRFHSDATEEFVGNLKLQYAHKTINVEMAFLDFEDSEEFEKALLEYIMNGVTPIEIEGGKHEIRYWMEFSVTRVTVQNG